MPKNALNGYSGVIFVCDVCLDELKIVQKNAYTIDNAALANSHEAIGWFIPDLVGFIRGSRTYFEIAASNIRCLCPKHTTATWYELERDTKP